MGSAEISGFGRFSGGRSNFSQMCTLLSQYLKENGSFGGLDLTQSFETKDSPVETMNLLPMIENSCPGWETGSGDRKAPPALFPQLDTAGGDETMKKLNRSGVEAAQMTIFYAGQVMVFDDLPADKAKEIMMLASKSSAPHSPKEPATGVHCPVPTFGPPETRLCPAQPPLDSDLPIARKNSLARFLQKRKDRITANAPYTASKPEVRAERGR